MSTASGSTIVFPFDNVTPDEITFLDEIEGRKHASIFKVSVRNKVCVMKVHHGAGPRKYYDNPNREHDIHVAEDLAYRRLKMHGLCARKIVPDFYGSLRNIDPKSCKPHLRHFEGDEYLSNAIFIEFVPDLESISLDNYTPERLNLLAAGLEQFHEALILHGDPYPRNMMIAGNRVLWIDFDRAQTYDRKTFTDHRQFCIREETELMKEFVNGLVSLSFRGFSRLC